MQKNDGYLLIILALAVIVWHLKEPMVVEVSVYPYGTFFEK